MDDLKNSRSSVADQDHNEAAQVNLALSDNPILREYTDRQLVASAGPRLYWEIYSATKNSTKEVIFWLDFLKLFFVRLGSCCLDFWQETDGKMARRAEGRIFGSFEKRC